MNSRDKIYLCLIAITILASASITGIANERIYRTLDEELTSDKTLGEGSALTAITLLESGRFGDPKKGYYGLLPRGPIYPVLLALFFYLFGKTLYIAWFLNFTLFFLALIIFFALCRRLLPSNAAYIPPFLLAAYWGATANIFIIQMEMLALFLIVSFVYLIFRYLDTPSIKILCVLAVVFGALVLTKPIILYFLPIAAGLLFFQKRGNLGKHRALFVSLIFVIIAYAMIGGWQLRNFYASGEAELGRGGHIFLTRAKSAEFNGIKLGGFITSAFTGDLIADWFFPGYAKEPEPRTTVDQILDTWYGKNALTLPETEINERFWNEGISIAKKHPIQFLLVTPVWMMRFNNPVGININDFDHLFTETHPEIPGWKKLGIILSIRIFWYSFLAIVAIGFFVQSKKTILQEKNSQYWVWILSLIVYFNLIHALFTFAHHRYVLPITPFYYMLLMIAFIYFVNKRHQYTTNETRLRN